MRGFAIRVSHHNSALEISSASTILPREGFIRIASARAPWAPNIGPVIVVPTIQISPSGRGVPRLQVLSVSARALVTVSCAATVLERHLSSVVFCSGRSFRPRASADRHDNCVTTKPLAVARRSGSSLIGAAPCPLVK